MRIRRNIIAPLILTIGAVGSFVAVPVVSALTAVPRCRRSRGGQCLARHRSSCTDEIKSPASRPPSIPPSRLRAAGFCRANGGKVRGKS